MTLLGDGAEDEGGRGTAGGGSFVSGGGRTTLLGDGAEDEGGRGVEMATSCTMVGN